MHVHVTPELVESLTTTAVSIVVAPGFSIGGGVGLSVTEIAPAIVTVIFAEAEPQGPSRCGSNESASGGNRSRRSVSCGAGAAVLVAGLNEPQEFVGRTSKSRRVGEVVGDHSGERRGGVGRD